MSNLRGDISSDSNCTRCSFPNLTGKRGNCSNTLVEGIVKVNSGLLSETRDVYVRGHKSAVCSELPSYQYCLLSIQCTPSDVAYSQLESLKGNLFGYYILCLNDSRAGQLLTRIAYMQHIHCRLMDSFNQILTQSKLVKIKFGNQ